MTKGQPTILVVDDDEDVLALAATFLSDQGYIILQASSGAEGLSIVQRDPSIDLLLTDVVMPGEMDGFDLALAARRMRPDLRVLYTSGFPKNIAVGKAGSDYGPMLPKPWRLRDLGAVVRQALG